MDTTTANSNTAENTAKPFTFGFTKKLPTKLLTDSSLRDASTKNEQEEKDYVLDVDSHKGIHSTKPKEILKELVIPCEGNKYKFDKYNVKSTNKKGLLKERPVKDLDIVAQELIQDSKDWEEKQAEENHENYDKNTNLTIRMTEDAEKALLEEDVKSRADVSSLDDYESIPVQGFGKAMLRGMFKEDEQDTREFKEAGVKCIEPVVRPKGLGLGASIPKKDVSKSKKSELKGEETLELVEGAYIFIEKGSRQDKEIHKYGTRYGQVDGIDEDSARVIVKMALGGATLSLSENMIRVVSKSEYKEYGKVVNKDEYNDHVKKEKARQTEKHAYREERTSGKESRSNGRPKEKNSDKYNHETIRKERSRSPLNDKHKRSKEQGNGHQNEKPGPTWLRPQLKVRIIDKYYKAGKYYKMKAIIEDVINPFTCICRTVDSEKTKLLDNVRSSYVETVIPKENGIVMILFGKHKGELGELLTRDKHKARAEIQLLDGKEVVRLDYDHLCEFTGEIDHYS